METNDSTNTTVFTLGFQLSLVTMLTWFRCHVKALVCVKGVSDSSLKTLGMKRRCKGWQYKNKGDKRAHVLVTYYWVPCVWASKVLIVAVITSCCAQQNKHGLQGTGIEWCAITAQYTGNPQLWAHSQAWRCVIKLHDLSSQNSDPDRNDNPLMWEAISHHNTFQKARQNTQSEFHIAAAHICTLGLKPFASLCAGLTI